MSSATEYRERVEHYITHRKCFITSALNLQTFFLPFGFDAAGRFGRRTGAGRRRETHDMRARPYSCWSQACSGFADRLRTAAQTPKRVARRGAKKLYKGCARGLRGRVRELLPRFCNPPVRGPRTPFSVLFGTGRRAARRHSSRRTNRFAAVELASVRRRRPSRWKADRSSKGRLVTFPAA